MISVTKPYLPDLTEYQNYIKEIWDRNYLTNNGPLVLKLEEEIKRYLGINNFLYTSNGTISMQIAIKALNLNESEIITTPFSYVATTSCIVWENCLPIFADIDPDSLNISPASIKQKITNKTKAILATHVFGNPCDVEEIEKIAKQHNLTVMYDAAHAFGTKYQDQSIMNYGDVSSVSFHATKLFHTIEGGGLISNNKELIDKMALMRNFGHNGFDVYTGVGINGKNSEFHAAMGLCNIKKVDAIIGERKLLSDIYDSMLNLSELKKQKVNLDKVFYNYAYYPVLFKDEALLLTCKTELEKNNIFTRRYFYPSLNTLEYVNYSALPVSEDISRRILCLPMYNSLQESEIKTICTLINQIIS